MSADAAIRPKFSQVSAAPAMSARAERAEIAANESVRDKQERVTERAHAHFETQGRQWVASRYRQLLLTEGPAPALRPDGASEDRSARLMRAAEHLVHSKQHRRLELIRMAGERMMGVGKTKDIGR